MKSGATFSEVIHSLIDFLFPPACPVCGGAFSGKSVICPDCIHAITETSYHYNPPPRSVRNIDTISILLPYDTHCRTLIHALKYHGMPSVGVFLGELMAGKMVRTVSPPRDTLLVPVPLHPSRLRERGYNQSERLARGFATFAGFEIDEYILTRTRATGTQTALDGEQRISNVSHAFRYTGEKSLSGRPVILIDDVMTTGSTLSECAGVLKEGGAGAITVSVAATPDIGQD